VSGDVTVNQVDNSNFCSGKVSGSQHFFEVGFMVSLAGKVYRVHLSQRYFEAPATKPIDGSVVAATLSSADYKAPSPAAGASGEATGVRYTARSGTLTVNAGGESGGVDAILASTSPAGNEHMAGQWTCQTRLSETTDKPVQVDLSFTGGVTGRMTSAAPDPVTGKVTATCRERSVAHINSLQLVIAGPVNGQWWTLTIKVNGNGTSNASEAIPFTGPGRYQGDYNQIALDPGIANPNLSSWTNNVFGTPNAAAPGTVAETIDVDPGETSGGIDATLHPQGTPTAGPKQATGPIHINGRYACTLVPS
jgi:hypothetical protein